MKKNAKKQWKKVPIVLRNIWFCLTAILMTMPYYYAIKQQEPIHICILKLLYSFLIMDILCSILEDVPLWVQKLKKHREQVREKQRKEKEEELQQKMQEQIQQEEEKQREILDGNVEYQELEKAELVYERLVHILQEEKMNEKENKKLNQLLKEIHLLLEILKEDNTHYEKAGYMLRVCLPELENITNIYLDMLSVTNTIQEEDSERYCSFLKQFKKYIESIKEQIYSVGKSNLEVSTSVMEKVMLSRMNQEEKLS